MPRGYRKPRAPGLKSPHRPNQPSSTLLHPPSPPPSANPHFIITEYAHSWEGPTLYIACVTDIACHLWLRWTERPVGMHQRTTTKSGYPFLADPKYCLVEYNEVEQNEAGDTLSHTFNFAGWAECEWRWWYIVGYVAGEGSPSASCIFQAHYLEQEEAESLRHPDLLEKESAGVMDHAMGSVIQTHLGYDIDAQALRFNADTVDSMHAEDIATAYPPSVQSPGQYYEWNLDSIDGFYQVTLGDAAITLLWYKLLVETGAIFPREAQILKYIRPAGCVMTWDKERRVAWRLKWTQRDHLASWLLMGANIGDPHIGFVIDVLGLYTSHKGAGAQRTHQIYPLCPLVDMVLSIWLDPDGLIHWYVDGVEVHTDDVDVPTGTPGADRPFMFRLYNLEAANKQAEIYGFRFVQFP